ncbi:hypothetical protein O181_019581 [Austropuccinia psidii MF-1]|uniref:SNF2 N-terminal domain-containing protein n=1 Tax=Austropuccinia psidii MF-1 TaxID=1389203 RepID=A0A9Q3C7F6_9BASI|nr:hypothetical protein [Austropuccinia psidii MF-1]
MTPPQSMINTSLLPHQKTGVAFLWDQEIPNRQSTCTLWATFHARHIIKSKVVSSFKSLFTNTPLGQLLTDDMGLGKTIKAIALIGTSKEWLIENYHCSMPTSLNHQLAIRNIQACSGKLQASTYHAPTCHSLSEANILSCDIFITSNNTITQEFKQKNTSRSCIFRINWHHIILDEAVSI